MLHPVFVKYDYEQDLRNNKKRRICLNIQYMTKVSHLKVFSSHLKKCHLAKEQKYKLSSQGFFPLDLEGRVVHLEGRMPDPANSSPLPFLSPSQSFFVTSYQYLFC